MAGLFVAIHGWQVHVDDLPRLPTRSTGQIAPIVFLTEAGPLPSWNPYRT